MKKSPKISLKSIRFAPNKSNAFIWFNVLFVIGLLLLGEADAISIIIAYFLETLIIGCIHIFKMYKIIQYDNSINRESKGIGNYLMILFFLFHYTFFVAIQSIFVFVLLEMKDSNIDALSILDNVVYIINNYEGVYLILISLAVFNIADFYLNFITNEKYKEASLEKSFTEPYGRIFIQQFAVILGFMFFIFSLALQIIAILIVLLKAVIDFYIASNPEKNSFPNTIEFSNKKSVNQRS